MADDVQAGEGPGAKKNGEEVRKTTMGRPSWPEVIGGEMGPDGRDRQRSSSAHSPIWHVAISPVGALEHLFGTMQLTFSFNEIDA